MAVRIHTREDHTRWVLAAVETLLATYEPLIAEMHRELDRQVAIEVHRIIDTALAMEPTTPYNASLETLTRDLLTVALMRTRRWAERQEEATTGARASFAAQVDQARRVARPQLGLGPRPKEAGDD